MGSILLRGTESFQLVRGTGIYGPSQASYGILQEKL